MNPASGNSSNDLEALTKKVIECCLQSRQTTNSQPIVKIASLPTVKKTQEIAIPPTFATSIEDVLEKAKEIFDHRVRNDHPRFFGFIPSPASDLSWLGEVLNTAYNTHAGSWYQSSGPSSIERGLIRWMNEDVIGFPEGSGGTFVSGGSMANLCGLIVARDTKLTIEEFPKGIAYMSDQTHGSVARGLRILGFPESQIRKIPSDDKFRLDVDKLKDAIRKDRDAGKKPFLIVGNCGTTNTGSIDPLKELSIVAEEENLWLHADGAYGATIILSKSHSALGSELKYCDSISWDAHKWLFQTYGCVMILMKSNKKLAQSFRINAEYIQDAAEGAEELPNFWNYSPELSRPSRAMKLWFSLQLIGLDKLGEMIDRGFELAETAQAELEKLSNWKVLSPAQMGIICFRFVPSGKSEEEIDQLNLKISAQAVESNLCAPLTTQLRGRTSLRMCSIHPDLKNEEMKEVIAGLNEIARSLLGLETKDKCVF